MLLTVVAAALEPVAGMPGMARPAGVRRVAVEPLGLEQGDGRPAAAMAPATLPGQVLDLLVPRLARGLQAA